MAEILHPWSWQRRREERIRRLSRFSLALMGVAIVISLMGPPNRLPTPPPLAKSSYFSESSGRRWPRPLLATPGSMETTSSRLAPASTAPATRSTATGPDSLGATGPTTASTAQGVAVTALPWGPPLAGYLRALHDPKTATATVEQLRLQVESALPVRASTAPVR